MKFFSAIILVASLATSATTAVSAASVTQAGITSSLMSTIMDDFSKLSRLYNSTVTTLNDFPQNGVQGATTVHNNEVDIETLFEDVNNELEALPPPVSQTDATKIIKTYKAFTPTIIQSLDMITAKAPDFNTLNAAKTMSADVALAAQCCAMFTGLIKAITPPQMMDEVNAMFTQLTTAREGASAALASVIRAS